MHGLLGRDSVDSRAPAWGFLGIYTTPHRNLAVETANYAGKAAVSPLSLGQRG